MLFANSLCESFDTQIIKCYPVMDYCIAIVADTWRSFVLLYAVQVGGTLK